MLIWHAACNSSCWHLLRRDAHSHSWTISIATTTDRSRGRGVVGLWLLLLLINILLLLQLLLLLSSDRHWRGLWCRWSTTRAMVSCLWRGWTLWDHLLLHQLLLLHLLLWRGRLGSSSLVLGYSRRIITGRGGCGRLLLLDDRSIFPGHRAIAHVFFVAMDTGDATHWSAPTAIWYYTPVAEDLMKVVVVVITKR